MIRSVPISSARGRNEGFIPAIRRERAGVVGAVGVLECWNVGMFDDSDLGARISGFRSIVGACREEDLSDGTDPYDLSDGRGVT
jgi:hypothetical protein